MKPTKEKMFVRVLLFACLVQATPVFAAEGGMGDYPLGLMGPQAGFLPDAGDYAKYDLWKYNGDTRVGANKEVPCCTGGLRTTAEIRPELDMFANVLGLMHVFEEPVLNGHAAVALTLPYVDADLDLKGSAMLVDSNLSGSGIAVAGKKTLSDENMGDSIATGMIGWHDGYWHYTTGLSVYMPTGHYDEGKPVNTSRNYWAIDPNAALTYLNESNGLEFSSALGLTINQENPYTDYRTGNELHLEMAAIQHLSKFFYAGLASYVYDQVSGDSGSGATLGEFKGKVYGVGPVIGGMVPLNDKQMLVLNARYYNETGAENRLEGSALWFSAAVSF